MAINRVDFGNKTLIDLSGDTLESAEQLMKGIIAHAKDGSVITGLMEAGGWGGSSAQVIFPPADGWSAHQIFYYGSHSLGTCSFDGGVFTGSAVSNQGAGMISTLTDLSGVNTLHIEFSASGAIDANDGQVCAYVNADTLNSGDNRVAEKVASAAEISAGVMDIDVSSLSGSYYIIAGVDVWRSGKSASCTITKITLVGDGSGGSGTDTSDATATESDILYPKTAYVNGVKVTGAVQSRAEQTYTPGTENQVIAAGQYLSGVQTIQGDQNLVSGNIKSGVSIFGIVGSYAGSAGSGGSAQSATGTMAGSGSNDMSFSVDFEPDLVCVCVSDRTAMQANAHMAGAIIVRDLFAQCAYRRASTTAFSNGSFGYDVTGLVRGTSLKASYSGGVCTVHAVQGSYKFISDCEYTWTAIKF